MPRRRPTCTPAAPPSPGQWTPAPAGRIVEAHARLHQPSTVNGDLAELLGQTRDLAGRTLFTVGGQPVSAWALVELVLVLVLAVWLGGLLQRLLLRLLHAARLVQSRLGAHRRPPAALADPGHRHHGRAGPGRRAAQPPRDHLQRALGRHRLRPADHGQQPGLGPDPARRAQHPRRRLHRPAVRRSGRGRATSACAARASGPPTAR